MILTFAGTRDSLIKGVIEQEELLGYSINAALLDEGFAARAATLNLYEKLRWDC